MENERVGHPVYPDGNVCISILHTGDDKTGYEQASERWSPVQSVEKVILSVISMLAGTPGSILVDLYHLSGYYPQSQTLRVVLILTAASYAEITRQCVQFTFNS